MLPMTPLVTIARDLGIRKVTLRSWVEATRPASDIPVTTDERTELQELRRRVRQLQMQRDIKKMRRPSTEGERVKFAFIAADKAHSRSRFSVERSTCRWGGFYTWVGRGHGRRVHPLLQ